MELYDACVEAGLQIDNHESDLYIRVTLKSQELVQKDGARHTVFTSPLDGQLWYDVPFAFLPFWREKQNFGECHRCKKKGPLKPASNHAGDRSYWMVCLNGCEEEQKEEQPKPKKEPKMPEGLGLHRVRGQGWRRGAPTDKQMDYLVTHKLTPNYGSAGNWPFTAGEANQMIHQHWLARQSQPPEEKK